MTPDSPTTAPIVHLSRRRKAAMIVQLLISDGNKLSLSSLPEAVQAEIAHELGEIRLVDRATVNAVASEFADILSSIGLSAPGGALAALSALSDHISPALAQRLQSQLTADESADPWVQIADLDVDQLVPVFEAESVEVGAIILSKLVVEKAAEVLSALPGERARRITFAVSQTENTKPATIATIGAALVAEYCKTNTTAFAKPPVDRIGAILNSSPAATREAMLTGLEGDDAVLAKSVRKAIFTFIDIPTRLKPTDIPAVLRDVPPDDVTIAIAYALGAGGELADVAEHILANMSQRMAGQIREDAAEQGTVKDAVGEATLNKVTASIRAMSDSGAITLIQLDDDEAEAA